jgi:serine/threonine-protein kinase RsbW
MNNEIRIRCNKKNLKLIRDFVTDYLATYKLSEIVLNQMVLAVDEICANLIIHANQENEDKFLTLSINHKNSAFLIEICDQGKSFTQANYKEPNIQDNIRQGKKGGVGIALVNRIMDRVEFHSKGDRNVCLLYKKV